MIATLLRASTLLIAATPLLGSSPAGSDIAPKPQRGAEARATMHPMAWAGSSKRGLLEVKRDDATTWTLDRRTFSSQDGLFRITFAARPGEGVNVSGHFFVELARRGAADGEFHVDASAGVFSDNAEFRRGFLSYDRELTSSRRLEVLVDPATYARVRRFVDGYTMADLRYDLLVANCVTFGAGVARETGLTVPKNGISLTAGGWTLPASYVEDLASANQAVRARD